MCVAKAKPRCSLCARSGVGVLVKGMEKTILRTGGGGQGGGRRDANPTVRTGNGLSPPFPGSGGAASSPACPGPAPPPPTACHQPPDMVSRGRSVPDLEFCSVHRESVASAASFNAGSAASVAATSLQQKQKVPGMFVQNQSPQVPQVVENQPSPSSKPVATLQCAVSARATVASFQARKRFVELWKPVLESDNLQLQAEKFEEGANVLQKLLLTESFSQQQIVETKARLSFLQELAGHRKLLLKVENHLNCLAGLLSLNQELKTEYASLMETVVRLSTLLEIAARLSATGLKTPPDNEVAGQGSFQNKTLESVTVTPLPITVTESVQITGAESVQITGAETVQIAVVESVQIMTAESAPTAVADSVTQVQNTFSETQSSSILLDFLRFVAVFCVFVPLESLGFALQNLLGQVCCALISKVCELSCQKRMEALFFIETILSAIHVLSLMSKAQVPSRGRGYTKFCIGRSKDFLFEVRVPKANFSLVQNMQFDTGWDHSCNRTLVYSVQCVVFLFCFLTGFGCRTGAN